MKQNKNIFHIFAVSDATGELAHNLAIAASRQFVGIDAKIWRKSRVSTKKKIKDVMADAKKRNGVILFTMVSNLLRRQMLSEAKKQGMVAMDIMGPALDMLSHYFHKHPSREPGLQYRITQDYFKRTESVEFAVRHDDGLDLKGLAQADIILMGISRTSKTPLSIYLAYHGYRCANVPIVVGVPIPEQVYKLDRKKMVGLIVSPDKLMEMRTMRLQKLGRSDQEHYAQIENIEKELAHAKEIFATLEGMKVVDVTGKAIEEVAVEIINELDL